MADRDDLADSFLALVDEAFRRLMDEPDAHLHVSGFAEGDVAFVLTREGLEVRRRVPLAVGGLPPPPALRLFTHVSHRPPTGSTARPARLGNGFAVARPAI
jgi:hypothetical protein